MDVAEAAAEAKVLAVTAGSSKGRIFADHEEEEGVHPLVGTLNMII